MFKNGGSTQNQLNFTGAQIVYPENNDHSLKQKRWCSKWEMGVA
jgi:hypothetical protein